MKLAARISRISVSKTMAVMEAAGKLREQGIDVVDFGPGEPDFPTPENVKKAGVAAIQNNFTKYTAIGGIKELKKAIVDKHSRDFGSKYDISECVVNFGGKHALFNIFSAVDRKSTRLNSSHLVISYAVFCLKKKKNIT